MPKQRDMTLITITPTGALECAECGMRFNWNSSRGKLPRYCSDECANRTLVECWQCGTACMVSRSTINQRPPACSLECAMQLRGGTPLPPDHWARWYGKASGWSPPKQTPRASRFVSGTCADCGKPFLGDRQAGFNGNGQSCSKRCARRMDRRIRRAREHGASGCFRWIDVIRVWVTDDHRCAYCRDVMTQHPEPDHVIPLSRGGTNDLSNILPSCSPCNIDKSDMTLDEWAHSRMTRGLPPIHLDPARYSHLVLRPASGTAWRYRMPA